MTIRLAAKFWGIWQHEEEDESVIAVPRIFSLKGIFRSGCAPRREECQRTGFTSVDCSWLGMTTRQSMRFLDTEYCVETVLCRRETVGGSANPRLQLG